ncbi:MAG: response regulator [Deltaproteobacteria bacterium]|nr:response regulator [Deltaproteobacteria bacterium]
MDLLRHPSAVPLAMGLAVAVYLLLQHAALWLGKRDDRLHLYITVWFGIAVVHLWSLVVQHATDDPATAHTCTRVTLAVAYAAGLTALAITTELAGRPLAGSTWVALVGGNIVAVGLLWRTAWFVLPETYVRLESSGVRYLAARPGPALPLFSLYGLCLLGWCVQSLWRSPSLPTSDRRLLAGGLLVTVLMALNDTAMLAQLVTSVHLTDYVMLIIGTGTSFLVSVRYNRLRRDLAGAVTARTRELADTNALLATTLARTTGALEDLQRSQASLKALLEALPDAVIAHRDGCVLLANQAARRLIGRADPVEGTPVASLLMSRADAAEPPWLRMPAQAGASLPPTPARLRRTGGPAAQVEISAVVVVLDGAPVTVMLARDLTERQVLHERLMTADRLAAIGTLSAGVAHEINNPLGFIQSNLEALEAALATRAGDEGLAQLGDAVRDMSAGVRRVRDIVRDLKAFARTDDSDEGPADVHAAVEQALRMAAVELRQRAEIVTDLAPVPMARGGEALLAQAVLNLVINAAHACEGTGRPGRVSVRTRQAGASIVVEVEDNGAGIADEDRERIFDPFFTTRAVGRGTGLGLSVCHGIVTARGGTLAVRSAPGTGSVFTVTLPVAREQAAPATGERPAHAAAPAWHLLVIDDEPMFRNGLRRMLTDMVVDIAASGAEALALDVTAYDAILCDLLMPGMSGLQLHRRLLEKDPVLAERVVFMSGGPVAPEDAPPLAAFRDRVLEKPFSRERLLSVVNARVAAAALRELG